MKILILTPHYPPIIGGAEVFTEAYANYLAGRGEEVHVVTGRIDRSLAIEKDNKKIAFHRISLISMKDLINTNSFYLVTGLPFMFLKSIKLVKKESIDIIHTVGVIASIMGALLSKRLNRPHVSTIQGWGLTKFSNGSSNHFVRRLVKYAISNSALVHCVSTYIERAAKELGAKRTLVVPNGVHLNRYRHPDKRELRKKLGLGEEKIILTVSRLIEIKGIKFLVEAMPAVLEHYNNIKLLVIGNGPEKPYLASLVDELGLKDKVNFLGHMLQVDVFSYLKASDVFVGPSLFEGLGIAFIEAMMWGTPIIGTNVGGIPDVIEHNVNGLLVPPGDSQAIAEAILNVLYDEELASRFSQNGMRTAREKFDWDNICEKIYGEYALIIRK